MKIYDMNAEDKNGEVILSHDADLRIDDDSEFVRNWNEKRVNDIQTDPAARNVRVYKDRVVWDRIYSCKVYEVATEADLVELLKSTGKIITEDSGNLLLEDEYEGDE